MRPMTEAINPRGWIISVAMVADCDALTSAPSSVSKTVGKRAWMGCQWQHKI